jgi:hypothetical protein
MKRNINIISFIFSLLIGLYSCGNDDLPENPTLKSPISALIITVNGEDYTATPQLLPDGAFNDTLLLSVKQPNVTGTVKHFKLYDNATANISEGDAVTFINNVLTVNVYNGNESRAYYVEMRFNPPPFLYLVKSSDRDENGARYYLNTATAQKIVSGTYNHLYEGYIDLTGTNWDNIGLVQSDLSAYFDYNGGWGSGRSSGSFVFTSKQANGTGFFPCDGPWADWKWKGANTEIVSPGVWKFNFDAATNTLDLTEIQWAITGSAAVSIQALTYSSATKIWTLTMNLSSGSLQFTTIPVTVGDPTVTVGESSSSTVTGRLSSGGNDITISSAGNYTIEMDLSNPPYYAYRIVKN